MLILLYIKLITAHLLSDFVFQPSSWVADRNRRHITSPALYYHTLVTGLLAGALTNFQYPLVILGITFSHFLIDLWKSYQRPGLPSFFIDQFLHLFVILLAGVYLYPAEFNSVKDLSIVFLKSRDFWIYALAIIFLSSPSGIIIGLITAKWRRQVEDAENSLGSAGRWIGILERFIIFILVVFDQYAAIGLLTAAKSILRFGETKNMPQRTEYVLIGTLISVSTAICIGLIVKTALL